MSSLPNMEFVCGGSGWMICWSHIPSSITSATHLDVSSAQVALSLRQWKLPHTYLVEYFLLQPKHMMVSAMSCNVHKAELKPHEIFKVNTMLQKQARLWNQPHTYIMNALWGWMDTYRRLQNYRKQKSIEKIDMTQ